MAPKLPSSSPVTYVVSQSIQGYWYDVLRMPVHGGWLVTTVITGKVSQYSSALSQSTVFVPDPDGLWQLADAGVSATSGHSEEAT